jgi:pSer/pThr/pTyr-binding forkhead associated (FHA) protein
MIAYLRNEDRIWEIPEGESAVGRGTDCTLPLDAARYPEISRKHVRFTSVGGFVSFRDDNSANGTLKNGVRLSSGELHAGDTLELGAGGPVFEMWQGPVAKADVTTRIQQTAGHTPSGSIPAAPPAPAPVPDRATAPTPAVTAQSPAQSQYPVTAESPTIPTPPVSASRPVTPSSPVSAPRPAVGDSGVTRVMPTDPGLRTAPPTQPTPRPPVQDGATRMMNASGVQPNRGPSPVNEAPRTVVLNRSGEQPPRRNSLNPDEEDTFVPPPLPNVQYASRSDNGFELSMEQKLGTLQKMLGGCLAVVVILLGLLLYQDREIEQNRQAIMALQAQASSSVALLMPELDTRMKRLNDRLDEIDPKMQKAQDKMVERMNHDLPVILDKYLNSRMGSVKGGLPAPPMIPGMQPGTP